MNQIKFYRVQSLPEIGEVGGLYFVYGGNSPILYLYNGDNFEQYSIDITEPLERLEELEITTASSISAVNNKIDENQQVTNVAISSLNNNKQDKEDNSLLTIDKTVVGAINELKQLQDITIPLLQASL